jgi:Tol biopolymer transport system component
VGDALAYAHGQGVVHRDVKPENILLENGHAVVADFGIARAITVAATDALTDTGLAVGTVQYMSPEQASGAHELDGRTDQYALACVLYETLAGEPPFTGPTPQAILARRLTETVRPLRTMRTTVPVSVEHAIERALARVPADRFASVPQFLESLSLPAGSTATPRHWRTILSATAAAVALGGIAVWSLLPRPFHITTTNAVPVTSSPGVEYQPALSPDGKLVAFVSDAGIAVSRTVSVGGSGELRPTVGYEGSQRFPAWSSDGESLRFWSCSNTGCGWQQVGRLGGPVRPLDGSAAKHAGLAWSHDGARAAFVQRDSIFVYTAQDDSTRLLTVFPNGELHSLAWSPNGRRIAFVNGNSFWRFGFNINPADIWVVNEAGARAAVAQGSLNVSPAWLDDEHLLFVSDREGQREIYAVEVGANGPRGAPQKVPGGTEAHSISLSADGSRLAFAKYTSRQHVWAFPTDGARPVSVREGRPITSGAQAVETHDVSRDGRWLIYDSNLGAKAGGGSQIYKMPIAGGAPSLVLSDGASPRWSPDGREVAYQNGGNWIAPTDGGTATRVVQSPPGHYDNFGLWSPDGLHLAFWSNRSGHLETWEVSRERVGGPWREPRQVTTFGCTIATWAPDGSGFLCRAEPKEREIVLATLQGAVLWRRDMRGAGLTGMPQFSADGSLIFLEGRAGRAPGIWALPLRGGKPYQVIAFDDPALRPLTYPGAFEVSGNRIYMTIQQVESDIWVMDLKR